MLPENGWAPKIRSAQIGAPKNFEKQWNKWIDSKQVKFYGKKTTVWKWIQPKIHETAVMIIYHFRPKQFAWLARHLDWVIRKTKAIKKWLHRVTLTFSAVEKKIFPKGNFLLQKYFLLLDNLFTPSFIFGLHLNYLIHYWKNMLNITPME